MADITSNLLRRYKFDEGIDTNAASSGSESSAGTLTAGVAWVPGRIGRGAVAFDATTDHVSATSVSTGITDQFTVACWANCTAAGNFPDIVANLSGTVKGFLLRLDSTTGKPQFFVSLATDKSITSSGASIVGAGWTHLAAVYNGTDIRLYVNGASAATPVAATGNIVFTGVTQLRIGNRSEAESQTFPGSVDEVRIYSRALTAEDVAAVVAFTGTGDCLSDIHDTWPGFYE